MSKHQKQAPPLRHRYYMLNKPAGCVSACRDREHQTVLDLFPAGERPGLFPMGRLDKNTEGLLLVTDDGKLNRLLLDPDNHIEKRYLLWAAGELSAEKQAALSTGLQVKGISQPLKPVTLQLLAHATLGALNVPVFANRQFMVTENPNQSAFCAEITLTEGKRHQIKRMLEAVGCTIVYLKRISFGGIALDNTLAAGEYRPLTSEECAMLKDICRTKNPLRIQNNS